MITFVCRRSLEEVTRKAYVAVPSRMEITSPSQPLILKQDFVTSALPSCTTLYNAFALLILSLFHSSARWHCPPRRASGGTGLCVTLWLCVGTDSKPLCVFVLLVLLRKLVPYFRMESSKQVSAASGGCFGRRGSSYGR